MRDSIFSLIIAGVALTAPVFFFVCVCVCVGVVFFGVFFFFFFEGRSFLWSVGQ